MTGEEIDQAVAAGKMPPTTGALMKQYYGIPSGPPMQGPGDVVPPVVMDAAPAPPAIAAGSANVAGPGILQALGGPTGIPGKNIVPGAPQGPIDNGASAAMADKAAPPSAIAAAEAQAAGKPPTPGPVLGAIPAALTDTKPVAATAPPQFNGGPPPAPAAQGGGPGGGGAPGKPWEPFTDNEKRYFADQLAYMKQQGATDQQIAEAIASGKVKQAALMQNATDQAEAMQAKAEAAEVERQNYVNQALATQQAEAETLAKTEIDPNHFWADKDTGTKLAMGVAVFLGGLKNGGNDALDLMQSQINRDIDAQKANLSSKYAAFAAKKGIYASRLEAFKDERMAEASAQASYWQWVGQKANANAMMTDSDLAKAGYQQAADAAAFKVKEFTDKIGMVADQKFLARQQAMAAAQAAQAAEIRKQNAKLFDANLDVAKEKAKAGGVIGTDGKSMPIAIDQNGQPIWKAGGAGTAVQVVTGINAAGEPIYANINAPDAASAGEMKKAGETYASLKSNIARLKALREAHGGGAVWSPDDQTEANTLATDIKLQMGVGYKLGALADKDLAMLDKLVPTDPLEVKWVGAIGQDPVGKQLNTLDAMLDQKYKIAAVGAGLPVPKALDLQKPPP